MDNKSFRPSGNNGAGGNNRRGFKNVGFVALLILRRLNYFCSLQPTE